MFTDWQGSTSPLTINAQSSAYVSNAIFLRAHLSVEIADVSGGSTVHLENVSFTDVSLAGGAVVSTTANDYSFGPDCYLLYDAYDDDSYDVAVTEVPPPRPGPAGADFRVENDTMSDCLFLLAPRGAVLPGCPAASAETRRRMRAGKTEGLMVDHGGGEACPVLAGLDSVGGGTAAGADGMPARFLFPDDPWLEAARQVRRNQSCTWDVLCMYRRRLIRVLKCVTIALETRGLLALSYSSFPWDQQPAETATA